MAAENVQAYRVSGEAPISVGTGSSGALEVLGISKDGVSIQIVQKERPVYTDVSGSQVPADFQRFGEEAFISMTLIAWNDSILKKCRNRPFIYPSATSFTPADGVTVPRGALLGTNGGAFSVAIAAQFELPWLFTTAKLLGQPQDFKVGTEISEYRLRFHAWTFIAGSVTSLTGLTSSNLPKLFERAIA